MHIRRQNTQEIGPAQGKRLELFPNKNMGKAWSKYERFLRIMPSKDLKKWWIVLDKTTLQLRKLRLAFKEDQYIRWNNNINDIFPTLNW